MLFDYQKMIFSSVKITLVTPSNRRVNIMCALSLNKEVIFQKSIDEGSLPSQWKSALVAPVFKEDDRSVPTIY
jgi:hypothetical protein